MGKHLNDASGSDGAGTTPEKSTSGTGTTSAGPVSGGGAGTVKPDPHWSPNTEDPTD